MTTQSDIREIKKTLKEQAKSIKIINREMGETRDEIQQLRLEFIKTNARLKEDIVQMVIKEAECTAKELNRVNQELGVIKEKMRGMSNGRQWFEKVLIFLLGTTLTIIGFLLR